MPFVHTSKRPRPFFCPSLLWVGGWGGGGVYFLSQYRYGRRIRSHLHPSIVAATLRRVHYVGRWVVESNLDYSSSFSLCLSLSLSLFPSCSCADWTRFLGVSTKNGRRCTRGSPACAATTAAGRTSSATAGRPSSRRASTAPSPATIPSTSTRSVRVRFRL